MDIDTDTGLETKDGLPAESVVTHAEMMRAFEEFKQTNDARTVHMERRSADVLLEEKLIRIDRTIDAYGRRLDEIALRNGRPAFGHGQANGDWTEHKAAFEAYVRSGENTNLRALESKALSAGSNPDGGFLVPRKSRPRSVNGSLRFRRSAPLPACARLAVISTENLS